MLTEKQRSEADGGSWIEQHERAAHQKRNWVRLTYDCNDHCIFCLDSQAHDGRMRDPQEVKRQILDGRRKGAERLILSGGEPTIHPRYIDFIKLGRLAGYAHIQTVTNGRLFRYRTFLRRCADAGLREITFSIHGPNAKVHDALVGVKGAFEEELEGLRNALADGRLVVNIDICVNRGNVKHLPAMIAKFAALGVREFDLLHVIPFGAAWREGKDVLFYDLEEMRPYLVEAFSWAKKPDMHIWLNRFPVKHCEGFHELIQDPYKLNDEIRGRKEEFQQWIDVGEPLDCREPRRCGYCYLQHVCDAFEETQREVFLEARFDVVRVDTSWEARQEPVFGGDPASAKRKRRLPMAQLTYRRPEELARAAGARTLHVVAPDLAAATETAARFGLPQVELELADWAGVEASELPITRLYVTSREDAEALAPVADARGAELVLDLTRAVAPWLRSLSAPPARRFALRQPTWERLTESTERDVEDLRAFFEDLPWSVPVEGLPACVLAGAPPVAPRRVYDAAMATPDGKLEAFRFVQRHILAGYFTKSLRCGECVHEPSCRGLHVNYVRAHGFAAMQPLTEGGASERPVS